MASRLGLISLAIAIAALLLAIAGCGGGDDDSTVASTETSGAAGSNGPTGSPEGSKGGSGGSKKDTEGAKKDGQGKRGDSPGAGSGESAKPPGGSEPSGAGKQQTKPGVDPKKRFATQVGAICDEKRKMLLLETGKYLQEQASQSDKQEALRDVTQAVLVPGMEAQIEAIRRLDPPPGSAQQVAAFLAAWERGLRRAGEGSRPLLGGHAERLLEPAADRARKAGFDGCAYS